MNFDREKWENITIHRITCPYCENNLANQELLVRTPIDNENSHVSYKLICQNEACKKEIIVHGIENKPFLEENPVTFNIKYVYPNIQLFSIPQKIPTKIKTELINSFSLFFWDYDACANKLRRTVEALLSCNKIPNYHIVNHKQKDLKLYDRIELLQKKKPKLDIEIYLHAIRKIGNTGSHKDNVSKENIFDCFEFISKIIDVLYNKQEVKLRAKAKKIANK